MRCGFVPVAAPFSKRLALSVLSLRAAVLPGVTAGLFARLLGKWVSVLQFRKVWSSAKGAIIQAPIPRTTETILWLEIKNLGMCSWTILFVRSCVGLGSVMAKRACPLKPARLKVLSKLL